MTAPQPITVEEQLDRVLASVTPLSSLDLTLLDAHGCVLAEDVTSRWALPPFDASAIDGYAVRAADVATASVETPIVLPVVGDVAAGSTTPYTVQSGLCVRITTGAPMPPGADAVVPVQHTDGGIAQVSIRRGVQPTEHLRRAGADAAFGTVVLQAGTHLGSAQIGLAAAVGRDRLVVRPRPRVVVLSTGSELVEPGVQLGPSQIPDANSAMLTAAVREAGAIAYRVGIVPDDPATLIRTLEDQLIRADMVVTSGGVSDGSYEVVKDTMGRMGAVNFGRVAMEPGSSQGFGTIGPELTPFFGLPGNPISSFVSFEIFVRPAIRRMLGVEPLRRPLLRARLAGPVESPTGQRSFLRGEISVAEGKYVATPVGGTGSHLIASLAKATCLIVVPEDTTSLAAGATVQVMLLERRHQ